MTQTETFCDACGKWLPSDDANWMEDGSSYCKTCRPHPKRKSFLWHLACLWCGHDWKDGPFFQDDVFTYWESECRRCGKVKTGSFQHYSPEPRR